METLWFWVGTIVFVGTYVLIASEKVHKTVAALLGASLMMFSSCRDLRIPAKDMSRGKAW